MGGTSTDVSHYAGASSGRSTPWWRACACARRCSRSTRSPPAADRSCTSTARASGSGPTRPAPTQAPPATGAAGPHRHRRQRRARQDRTRALPARVRSRWPTSRSTPTAVRAQFADLAAEIAPPPAMPARQRPWPHGFVAIAVDNMANAIKRISMQRGHDITRYALCASAAPADSTPVRWPTRSP